jgi:hypothetical protein
LGQELPARKVASVEHHHEVHREDRDEDDREDSSSERSVGGVRGFFRLEALSIVVGRRRPGGADT